MAPEDLIDLSPDEKQHEAGPAEGPWNGIAVFDHPDNDGYPNVVGKYAMAEQITQTHYPPAATPHGSFSFRQRVLVHDGAADDANVEAIAADYWSAPRVEVS